MIDCVIDETDKKKGKKGESGRKKTKSHICIHTASSSCFFRSNKSCATSDMFSGTTSSAEKTVPKREKRKRN